MKILFSNPPWWEGHLCGVRAGSRWPHTYPAQLCAPDRFQFGEYLPVPFFASYAASYARHALGAEVVLRDSIAMRESYRAYFDAVVAMRPDMIVIETATPSWPHDRLVVRRLRELLPSVEIVLTGTISEANPDELLQEFGLAAIIRGEYEKGIVAVANGARGIIAHQLLTVAEMNAAPFPDYPADTWSHYCDHNPIGQVFPHAQVWASRGCPFKCIFCVWPAAMTGNDPDGKSRRTVRHYSPEYMTEHLRRLTTDHPFRSIYFDDDTFNLGNSHTLRMCAVMREIGLPWSAMCRADTISRDTWQEMKDSGCFGVKLGFESGNQWVVDHIVNKHLDLAEAADTVRHLKQIGMTVHGTFTVGLPGETPAQAQDTLRFIESLPLDSHQLSGTAEIEGTPLASLRRDGHLDAYDGAKMDAGYTVEADGAKKFRDLVRELKTQ
jgi:radical SAM superfamily enzyme YgiQ (UPF0313 family)